jgi:predicted hotdog family 3-hydroxylacyl-ACP dehydratase
MRTSFHIPLEQSGTPDQIQARCMIPADSPWFSGHFPSNPIFPALGMMGMVDAAVSCGILPENLSGSPRSYKRVRFRQIVRPGDLLSLTLTPDSPGVQTRFRFKIFKETDPISEGVILTNGIPPDPRPREAALLKITARADAAIEDLVPHRGRMRLVDVFEGHDEAGDGITHSVAKETWPLCRGNCVNPHVMIELVAQATAAMAGWNDSRKGKRVGFGYIVGIKSAWLSADPIPVGALLTMKTRNILTQDNYGVFSGSVHRDARFLSEVVLQVFRPEQ